MPAEQLGQPGAGPVLARSPAAWAASPCPFLRGFPSPSVPSPHALHIVACQPPAPRCRLPSRGFPTRPTGFGAGGNSQGLKRLLASSSVI